LSKNAKGTQNKCQIISLDNRNLECVD